MNHKITPAVEAAPEYAVMSMNPVNSNRWQIVAIKSTFASALSFARGRETFQIWTRPGFGKKPVMLAATKLPQPLF